MDTKIFGGLCVLVLIAGIGSFALEHSAYAQPKTKVDLQKENRAKAQEKITNDEKTNPKMQKFKELASKMTHAKFKVNNKSKR